MLAEHWDEVPLETWQRLAGYAIGPDGLVWNQGSIARLSDEAMWELLSELRSDFGADSAFLPVAENIIKRAA